MYFWKKYLMISDDFSSRHIGPSDKDIKKMLDTMGLDSIEKLLNETIPETIRLKHPLKIPNGMFCIGKSESDATSIHDFLFGSFAFIMWTKF